MLQREKEKAERDAGNLQLAKKLEELQRQSRMEERQAAERQRTAQEV